MALFVRTHNQQPSRLGIVCKHNFAPAGVEDAALGWPQIAAAALPAHVQQRQGHPEFEQMERHCLQSLLHSPYTPGLVVAAIGRLSTHGTNKMRCVTANTSFIVTLCGCNLRAIWAMSQRTIASQAWLVT